MIESGFNPTATSHAEAVGVWQFIPSTGKQYGLIINDVIDERDPIRSTRLLPIWQPTKTRNWHLAMVYNAGGADLQSHQRKSDHQLLLTLYANKKQAIRPPEKTNPGLETCHRTKESTCYNHRRHGRNGRGAIFDYNPQILKERLIVETDDVRYMFHPRKQKYTSKIVEAMNRIVYPVDDNSPMKNWKPKRTKYWCFYHKKFLNIPLLKEIHGTPSHQPTLSLHLLFKDGTQHYDSRTCDWRNYWLTKPKPKAFNTP